MRNSRYLSFAVSGGFLVMLFWSGCQEQQSQEGSAVSAEERATVVSEVTAAMNSYGTAVGRLDVERTIGHYANEPEFRVCFDNHVTSYDAFVSQVRQDFASMAAVEGGFTSITVILLGPGVAAAIAPFRERFADQAGNWSPVIKGTVTWVWVRRGADWKILYGHATHEPDASGDKP